MANSFNTDQTSITTASSDTTVFTASASTTLIKSVRVVHASGTSSATLSITKSGSATRTDMNTVALSQNVLTDLISDVLPLESGDVIKVRTSHQPSEVFVSYVENTTSVSAQSIDVLSDVDITTTAPTNGQTLVWNDSANEFQPGDAGGGNVDSVNGATGTVVLDVEDLDNVAITTKTNEDVIVWDGNDWVTSQRLALLYELLKEGTSKTITAEPTNADETEGFVKLEATNAKLKVNKTGVDISETSPGTVTFQVATDSSGATEFDAAALTGLNTANEAQFIMKHGTQLVCESSNQAQGRVIYDGTGNSLLKLPTSSGQIANTSDIATDSAVVANTAKVGITTAQANAITANTAKTSFPGFGTTAGTALEGNTALLQIGTTAGTALEGDTTTITTAQANAITANTAKTTFPGFGTTAGTALEGDTALLQLGTTSSTALAGDTTTITTAQANAITANTAKTSFPGFGTTAGTALEGNTSLLQLGTTSTTALAGDTAVVLSINSEFPDQDGEILLGLDAVTSGGGTLGGDIDLNGHNIEYPKTGNTDHSHNGDIIKIGTGTTVQGELVYLTSSGTWASADADDVAKSGNVLLAISLGTNPSSDGMLIRGMYTLQYDPGTIADALYVSTSAGEVTSTAPTGAGDVVRVVGYCLDSTNGQIYFNPSNDWIELS